MAILRPYQAVLGNITQEQLRARFLSTLADTNRTFAFFVDWQKVERKVKAIEPQLRLLAAAFKSQNPAQRLTELLRDYPEAARAIPIMVAARNEVKVLEDPDANSKYLEIDFHRPRFSEGEIERIVRFCERTGLLDFIQGVVHLRDYATGVEVGMDTNARKNRSGTSMERLVLPLVEALQRDRKALQSATQKSFGSLEKIYDLPIPESLRHRTADIAVFVPGSWRVNIETNFYSGIGSKPQEIVDAYIQRQRDLRQAGWRFVWVTDGEAWRGQVHQLDKAFKEMDYVLNVEFIRRGILRAVLEDISASA